MLAGEGSREAPGWEDHGEEQIMPQKNPRIGCIYVGSAHVMCVLVLILL